MSIVYDLCGIGNADIVFIDELIEEWDIDTESITRQMWYDASNLLLNFSFDANNIIHLIYRWIADEYELPNKNWSCSLNCLDSHFYYKGEEIYDKESLI